MIFASYSKKDQPDAKEALGKWLEHLKEPGQIHQYPFVWVSPDLDVRKVIRQRIKASDSFVVVWTKDAPQSPWVLYQLGMAHALGMPITVLLAGGEPAALPREIGEAKVVHLEQVSS